MIDKNDNSMYSEDGINFLGEIIMGFIIFLAHFVASLWIITSIINLGVRLGYNKVMKHLQPEAKRFTFTDILLCLITGPFALGLVLGSAFASLRLTPEVPDEIS